MFLKRKEDFDKLDTLIGHNAVLEGNLMVKEGLRVDGTVKGKIKCQGHLVIGEHGKIEGDIITENIIVDGEVIGNITANEKLEITCRGRVRGDIEASRLVMKEGVAFEGSSRMSSNKLVSVPQPDKKVPSPTKVPEGEKEIKV